MGLSDSGRSIGAVAALLRGQLDKRINTNYMTGESISPTIHVTVGRNAVKQHGNQEVLNLNLYEFQFDSSMKNTPCKAVTQPAWLVLKFLMTAFDTEGDSDSTAAHIILSRGIQALQELNYLGLESLAPDIVNLTALQDNPEPLKITFDSVNPELLSKLIQGTNEVFRVSVGFQVRPVLIASGEIPRAPLLVGVDYTKDVIIGYKGLHIDISVMRQPSIHGIFPARTEAVQGAAITLYGSDLNLPDLVVRLGTLDLPITAQKANELKFVLNSDACSGGISAGNLPVAVVKILPSGHRSTSNVLNCEIFPVFISAALVTDGAGSRLELGGTLLGGKNDDIIIILLRENKPAYLFDSLQCTPAPAQDKLTVECTKLVSSIASGISPLKPGQYQVVLRVNGQQAFARHTVVFP